MPQKGSKTALVLAGGGLTGAVYEIGALRAIDDLLLDRSVNEFDLYIGTSAGALVAAFIASGLSPEAMLQVIDGTHQSSASIKRKHVFNLNWWDQLHWGLSLPKKLIPVWWEYLSHLGEMTFFDLLWSLSNSLPAGLYDSTGLAEFVQEGQHIFGYPDDFQALERQLLIIATDLDNGERAIFGPGYQPAAISQAVAASAAMPLLYKPVRIGEHEYIDGGTRGNASLDLAIEQGATLVVCINPIVPIQYDQTGHQAPFLSDTGVQAVMSQSFRIMMHAGIEYHLKQVRRAHPEVDIILIEPSVEDHQMFLYNIMRYSARLEVARHGFESVTLDLARDYPQYKETLARHGIPISRRLVIEELNEIAQSGNDPQVIRRVLEARHPACKQRGEDDPLCQLQRTLNELEIALQRLA